MVTADLETEFDTVIAGSAFIGILNAVLIFTAVYGLEPVPRDDPGLFLLVAALEFFGMGCAPGYLFLRYRLVAPLAWSGLLTALAITDQQSFHPFVNLYVTYPAILLALGVVAVLGVVEYAARDSIPFLSHDALV